MGQTVNLLSFDFGGSNPSAPTIVEAHQFAWAFVVFIRVVYGDRHEKTEVLKK